MLTPSPTLKYLSHRDQLGAHVKASGVSGDIVEVGTLYGAFATILLRTFPGRVHCVDPWINQPDSEYFDGANKADMNRIWATVQRDLGRNPRCTLHREMSLAGAEKFEDGSLAAVYLDGNHALPSVRADIAHWFPKVKIGGIFSGHDFFTRYDKDTNSDAQTAVMEFAERVGRWPHVTWCSSWFFVKTAEMEARYHGRPVVTPMPIDRSKTPLVAVLAVSHVDHHLACKWLKWAALLSANCVAEDAYKLIVFGSKAMSEEMWDALRDAANGIQPPPTFRATPEVYERGYGASANYTFRTSLECVEREYPGHGMVWCEADSVPMHPSWMAKIADEYHACGKPFMGDFVEHPKGVAGIDHMTGTAVYPPDWRTLAPSLAILPEPRPAQGWDSLCAHELVPQMARAKTIQQVWRPPLPITADWAQANIPATTALFHQCKDGSLIDVLCATDGVDPIPLGAALPRYITPAYSAPITTGDRCDIMIVTCKRDLEFLHYLLRSIDKYATGFGGVTLVAPEQDRRQFAFAEKRDGMKLVGFNEREGKGMLHHEIMICRGDEICREAGTILHLDADLLFWRHVTPVDYLPGGKCLCVRERYEWIAPRNPNRLIWRDCVRAAVGITPEWETMTRHPQIYPRALYGRVRHLVEQHTGMGFDDFVFSRENGFPQGFAEHPLMGAVAIRDMPERFHFVDYDHDQDARECGVPDGTAFQYLYQPSRDACVEAWSHGGFAAYKKRWEQYLRGDLPKYHLK